MSIASSPEHNRLIRATVARMLERGRNGIFADHVEGYHQPKLVNGFIPDVLTTDLVAECETSEGLAQAHTTAQWKAFLRHAVNVGGYFIAVVADPDASVARQLLRQVAGDSKHAILWTF